MNGDVAGLGGPAALLRVFIGDRDRHGLVPLYEAIVVEARRAGLAGATVLGGTMGFGANSRVHRAHLFGFSEDLPVVIEMVDDEAKLRAFLPVLEQLMSGGGMITLERVLVLRDRPHEEGVS